MEARGTVVRPAYQPSKVKVLPLGPAARCVISVLVTVLLPATVARSQIVVDNDDGYPAYMETGSWTTSGSTGYDGGTYRFAYAGDSASATWTGSLPDAGEYEVFVWYVNGSNNSLLSPHPIPSCAGTGD